MDKIKYLFLVLLSLLIDVRVQAQNGTHDPLAKLDDPDEVSIFLESATEATYTVWAYNPTTHPDGGYYANGAAWPGQTMKLVGKLGDGNYLYKWTKDASLDGVPATLIICKDGGDDANKIYNDKPFYNHGYYLYDGTNVTPDGVIGVDGDNTGLSTYGHRVMYELNLTGSTWADAQTKLQAIKNLGVDVVWVKPATDNAYDNATVKAFVDAAHALNIDVWLDYVTNLDNNSTEDAVQATITDMKNLVTATGIDGFRLNKVVDSQVTNAVWKEIIDGVKNVKIENATNAGNDENAEKPATIQILADADFSSSNTDPDNGGISPSNFQYDTAKDFNTALTTFGTSDNAGSEAEGEGDLTHIVYNGFISKTNFMPTDRMVYLTDHNSDKTLQEVWGDNRYAMTAMEFTLPGMPLVYNGQETDATMASLITAMSALKHSNASLADGNSYYLRGKTALLKATSDGDGNNIFAYERTNGNNNGYNHVMVIMNLSDQAQTNVKITGATEGTWSAYLTGDNTQVTTTATGLIGNIDANGWTIASIPAHGYYVMVSTSKSNNYKEGLYIEMNDSWGTQNHQMIKLNNTSDADNDTYQFVINARDYAALSTAPGGAPDENGKISFKFRDYTPYYNNVIKNSAYYGANDGEGVFTKDGTTSYDFTTEGTEGANGVFSITKTDGVQQYKITLTRSKTDGNTGTVSVEYITNIEQGYFLITPKNIGDEKEKTPNDRTWPMLDAIADPDAVADLANKYDTEKDHLYTYTINASDFDNYMPDNMKNAQAIEFRIRPYGVDNDGQIKGNTGYMSPAGAGQNDYSAKDYSFTFSENNNYYENAWWPTREQNKDAWFIIRKQPDVAKYIIQTWQAGGEGNGMTRVRVSYVKTYDYVGSKIEDVLDGQAVYFYNVDAHKFLYVGNLWGTMASLLYSDLGLRCNITRGEIQENPDFVHIQTPLNNWAKDLGIDHTLGEEKFNDYYIFADRNNGDRWVFEKADNIDYANTYYMKLYLTHDHKYHYIFADPNNPTQVEFKAVNDGDEDAINNIKNNYASRWQIVTRKDLINKLRNENADLYGGTSADATFLMRNQGFSRMTDPATERWNTNGADYTDDGCKALGEDKYGMYYNAHITGKGQVWQEVTVPMWGIYRMDAYGFYKGSKTNMYCQIETAEDTWSNIDFNGKDLVNDESRTYTGAQSDVDAGTEFYNESVLGEGDKYQNTLFFNVQQNYYTDANNYYHIRIGFNKTDDKDGDYTAVDDVHLHYIGKSPFLLDEESTADKYITDENHTNMSVYIKRQFKVDTWNTLILPVNLTTSTLTSIFGDRVEVAEPYGLDDDNPYCIKFTPVSLDPGGTPILAGKCYIVKPSKLVSSKNFVSINSDNEVEEHTVDQDSKERYYDLGRHNMDQAVKTIPETEINKVYTSANDNTGHNSIRFIGSYTTTQVPAKSYVFASDKKMHYTSKVRTMGGFRFYIIDTDKDGNNINAPKTIEAKMSNLANDYLAMLHVNHVKNVPTSINNINTGSNKTPIHFDGNIYDLSGRCVGKAGTQYSLPKGVYILNGRKFIKQ